MESFRMTEVIEAGCIPILDDQGTHFNHAWHGIHKFAVTTSRRWGNETFGGEDLLAHVLALLKDSKALDRRQAAMLAWYAQHKIELNQKIEAVLDYVLHDTPMPPPKDHAEHAARGPSFHGASSSSRKEKDKEKEKGGKAKVKKRTLSVLLPADFSHDVYVGSGEGAFRKAATGPAIQSKYSTDNRYSHQKVYIGKNTRIGFMLLTFVAIVLVSKGFL